MHDDQGRAGGGREGADVGVGQSSPVAFAAVAEGAAALAADGRIADEVTVCHGCLCAPRIGDGPAHGMALEDVQGVGADEGAGLVADEGAVIDDEGRTAVIGDGAAGGEADPGSRVGGERAMGDRQACTE